MALRIIKGTEKVFNGEYKVEKIREYIKKMIELNLRKTTFLQNGIRRVISIGKYEGRCDKNYYSFWMIGKGIYKNRLSYEDLDKWVEAVTEAEKEVSKYNN